MKLTKKVISGMLSASLSVTLLTGIPYNVNNNGIKAQAESVAPSNTITTLETDVETASEGCTMLGVYGSYYSQAKDALNRINEIRKEACEDGNVPDPENPSRMLSPSDYVPAKWSKDLESIARIRAMEGGLALKFLSSGHSRLNGKNIWSVQYNGVRSYAENLAYNWNTSMVSGINQWYEEKNDWVGQSTEAVTGHYTSIINPKYTYIGLGDFYTEEAQYPNTLAGAFCSSSEDLDQSMQEAQADIMQKIEVKDSYISGYTLEGSNTINAGSTTKLELRVNLTNNSKILKLWIPGPVTYTSSDTSIAQVTDTGTVTGLGAGTATITVQSGNNELASMLITVNLAETPEPIVTPSPTPAQTPVITPSPEVTQKPAESVSPSPEDTQTPTASPFPTASPVQTPTASPSPAVTPAQTPTASPSPTASPVQTPTASPFPTITPAQTPTVPEASTLPSVNPSTAPSPVITPTVPETSTLPSEKPSTAPSDNPSYVNPTPVTPGIVPEPSIAHVVNINQKVSVGSMDYKVTSVNGAKTVEYTGTKININKIVIPASIKINGDNYKVTSIAKNGFKGNKKLSKVTIGANIKKIGKNAFLNCSNLKNIVIKTKKLTAKTVGKNAFKGINKKAIIKVPGSKIRAYSKIIKTKGATGRINIKK